MKNKVLIFIIGLLVGAIISTVGFIIYENNNKPSQENSQMMQGTGMNGSNQGTPPEKPVDSNGNEIMGTPPEKPAENMQNANSSTNKLNTTNEM